MKKATILILIILAVTAIYRAVSVPEWVKINAQEVSRCTADMVNNPELICD